MRILITITFILMASVITTAQTECPAGMVCISQQAANKAAENARELEAVKNKVSVLEDSLKSKDKSIAEIRETARLNEADLRERLHKTEVELSLKTGQMIQSDAERVRLLAIIEALLKVAKPKKFGIINF